MRIYPKFRDFMKVQRRGRRAPVSDAELMYCAILIGWSILFGSQLFRFSIAWLFFFLAACVVNACAAGVLLPRRRVAIAAASNAAMMIALLVRLLVALPMPYSLKDIVVLSVIVIICVYSHAISMWLSLHPFAMSVVRRRFFRPLLRRFGTDRGVRSSAGNG